MRRKKCIKCKAIKLTDEFYLQRSSVDGLQAYCKQCSKEKKLEWNIKNKDRRAMHSRRWTKNNKDYMRIARLKNKSKFPKKVKVKDAFNYAVKKGEVIRPVDCLLKNSNCRGSVHAHHDDYNKPLSVRGFCAAHHAGFHRVFKSING